MLREIGDPLGRLMTFVIANGLAPRSIEAGDEVRLEAEEPAPAAIG